MLMVDKRDYVDNLGDGERGWLLDGYWKQNRIQSGSQGGREKDGSYSHLSVLSLDIKTKQNVA